MTRRPRMQDDLFELFQDKKEHDNQSIGEVLLNEFPELEEELEQKKQENQELFSEEELETDLMDGGLL